MVASFDVKVKDNVESLLVSPSLTSAAVIAIVGADESIPVEKTFTSPPCIPAVPESISWPVAPINKNKPSFDRCVDHLENLSLEAAPLRINCLDHALVLELYLYKEALPALNAELSSLSAPIAISFEPLTSLAILTVLPNLSSLDSPVILDPINDHDEPSQLYTLTYPVLPEFSGAPTTKTLPSPERETEVPSSSFAPSPSKLDPFWAQADPFHSKTLTEPDSVVPVERFIDPIATVKPSSDKETE